MIIRQYDDEDYVQLTNLYRVPALYGGEFDEERDTPERLLATSDEMDLHIVTDDVGLIIGSIMLLSNAHSFWILRFVIDDHHPEHEFASRMLVERAEEIANARNHTSMIVYSSPKYEELGTRYRKLGFRESNDYKCFWKEVTYEV